MEVITKDNAMIPAETADIARTKRIDQYRYKLQEMKWRNAKNAGSKRFH